MLTCVFRRNIIFNHRSLALTLQNGKNWYEQYWNREICAIFHMQIFADYFFYIFGSPEFIRGRRDEMNRLNFLLSLGNVHLFDVFDSKLYVYGLNKYHWTDQYDPIQTRFCTVVNLVTVVWLMMYGSNVHMVGNYRYFIGLVPLVRIKLNCSISQFTFWIIPRIWNGLCILDKI